MPRPARFPQAPQSLPKIDRRPTSAPGGGILRDNAARRYRARNKGDEDSWVCVSPVKQSDTYIRAVPLKIHALPSPLILNLRMRLAKQRTVFVKWSFNT